MPDFKKAFPLLPRNGFIRRISYDRDMFFDQYGLVRPRPGQRGEHGILFRAYLDYLTIKTLVRYEKPEKAFWSNFDTPEHFSFNPPEYTPKYSVADMTGMYAMALLHDQSLLQDLPIIAWNNRLHFDLSGLSVFLSIRFPRLKKCLWSLVTLLALISCNRHYSKAEGKLLWWLRLHMLGMHKVLRTCEKVVKRSLKRDGVLMTRSSPFGFCFDHHFTGGFNSEWLKDGIQLDHPILRYKTHCEHASVLIP